jgi:CRISPR/Cas system Type II protein with McrA/HNH and RuvC-like nuclease domain
MQRDRRARIKSGDHKVVFRRKHPEGKKICGVCGEIKTATTEFFVPFARGYLGLKAECRNCTNDRRKERRREDWAKRLIEYSKGRHHKHTDEPYDLTTEKVMQMWEQQSGRCLWFGVEMTIDVGSVSAASPRLVTLDRVDCARGYTADNVILVSKAANQARGNFPAHEFKEFVAEIKRN